MAAPCSDALGVCFFVSICTGLGVECMVGHSQIDCAKLQFRRFNFDSSKQTFGLHNAVLIFTSRSYILLCVMCECSGCGVQELLVLTFVSSAMLGSAQGTGLNESCSSSSCFEVFASEFDESKLACNATALQCQCKFQVLDLAACVVINTSGEKKYFDLVVTEVVGNVAASKYTAECRNVLEKHGPCRLEEIMDGGFKITPSEIALTASGVAFEMISAYQMVLVCLALLFMLAPFGMLT